MATHKHYIIRAAMKSERFEGWVWQSAFPSGTFFKITNVSNGRTVICEAREVDEQFVNEYNDHTDGNRRLDIEIDKPLYHYLVIPGYFRSKLQIATTDFRKTNGRAQLILAPCKWQWLGRIRAHLQHPNSQVAATTWLTLVGIFVGLVGVISVVLDAYRLFTGV